MKNFCRGLAFCFCPVGRLYETGLSTAEAGCRTLFLRLKRECGFVVPPWAALFYLATHLDFIWQRTSISITSSSPAWRVPTWFRWRKSGRRAESASGGDGLLANPRIVARRRFQASGRRYRNRSGGFLLLFDTEKQGKNFSLVLLGPKVPKASARRSPREGTARGAARGAQDQALAPPCGGRAAARTLFFRVKRECGFVVPPKAA